MEYKIFKDEQPEAGRLVEILDTFDTRGSYRYDSLRWENGIPLWRNGAAPLSDDEWRYSTIGEPKEPCTSNEPCVPDGPESAHQIGGITILCYKDGRYKKLYSGTVIPNSEQQAAWNNHINPRVLRSAFKGAPMEASTLAHSKTPEQILELLKSRIKVLEGKLETYESAYEDLHKEIQALNHIVGIKDKKINTILLELIKYQFAALGKPEEA